MGPDLRTEAGPGAGRAGGRTATTPDYGYRTAEASCTHAYLWPVVAALLRERAPAPCRLLDLGCGNGAVAGALQELGYAVDGVDPSESGISLGRENYPACRFSVASAYDDLASKCGRYPVVVCLEVIEHLYSPGAFASTLWDVLEPGGTGVISTPFHGYWKNLALAIGNRFDTHFSPEWEGGHIKFWSERTLGAFLRTRGFVELEFRRAGRVAPLAKSMVVAFRRPSEDPAARTEGPGGRPPSGSTR